MISDERAVKVLVDHQRRDAGSCLCGWSKWGHSHSEHVWRMLKLAAHPFGSVTYTVTVEGTDDSSLPSNPLT